MPPDDVDFSFFIISPSAAKKLKENAIKTFLLFPKVLVVSSDRWQQFKWQVKPKNKIKTMFESNQIEEKKVGPVFCSSSERVCGVGGRGLMLLTAKLTMGRAARGRLKV